MFWNFVSLLESSILHMCVFLKQLHPIVNYRYLEGSRFGILKTIEYAHHRLNNCSYRAFCLCIIIDSRILRSPLDTSQIFNFSRKKDPPTVSTGVVQQLKFVGFPTKCKNKNPSYEKCQNTIFWGFGKFRVSQKLLSYVVSYSVIGNGWVASIYVMTFRLTLR